MIWAYVYTFTKKAADKQPEERDEFGGPAPVGPGPDRKEDGHILVLVKAQQKLGQGTNYTALHLICLLTQGLLIRQWQGIDNAERGVTHKKVDGEVKEQLL